MYQIPEMFGELYACVYTSNCKPLLLYVEVTWVISLVSYIIIIIIGAVNEIHGVNPQLWIRGMLDSSSKPLLCPHFLEETENLLMLSLRLRYQDITKFNCICVHPPY